MAQAYKLTVAPNGARRHKSDHPALPITTADIEKTALACYQAGADEIHLHVREDDGSHSLDVGRYREAIHVVSDVAPSMTIQITTESAGKFSVSDQFHCLEALRPAAASISVREMARDEKLAAHAYALAGEAGTSVQHILYSPDCVKQLLVWRRAKIVPAHMSDVIFVLGQYAPEVLAQPNDLNPFLNTIAKHGLNWTVCAFGKNEHACLAAAVARGGNVRIGFENNTQMPDGTPFESNAASVTEFIKNNPKST
jgi:uncharacterized protein (DUF849 family)